MVDELKCVQMDITIFTLIYTLFLSLFLALQAHRIQTNRTGIMKVILLYQSSAIQSLDCSF